MSQEELKKTGILQNATYRTIILIFLIVVGMGFIVIAHDSITASNNETKIASVTANINNAPTPQMPIPHATESTHDGFITVTAGDT